MHYLIGVLADSHGQVPDYKVIFDKLSKVDILIHCGDGYRDGQDIAYYLNKPIVQVLGNNDFCDGKDEDTVDIFGHRIFVAHGHNHRVRGGDRSVLAYAAAFKGAAIACFGHTHRYEYTMVDDVHIFNPGNLTPTERQKEGTIGFIRLYENGMTPDFWYEQVC